MKNAIIRIGITALILIVGVSSLTAESSGGPAESSIAVQLAATQRREEQTPSLEELNALVEQLLRNNPSIQASRKQWQASTKRPSQLSSLPNPELAFTSMSGGNPLPYSTIGNAPLDWASFMFMQKIPWPGKLNLRGEIAETESDQAAQNYRSTTLKTLRQLKETYFELYYVDQARQVLNRYRDLLGQFAGIAEARYRVGEGIQADVLRSQVEISLIMERLEVLDQRRESVQARINSVLNRSPDVTVPPVGRVRSSLPEVPFSLERMYLAARETNPEIEMERLEIQKSTQKLSLARKDFFPDLSVSANYFLRAGAFDNMYEYRLGLEIPLYFWRKERLAVEENVEELDRSQKSYQSKLQEITFQIKDSYISARTSERLIRLYREAIIPQTTAALDSVLSAYEVGTVDFLTLVDSVLTLLNYDLQYEEQIHNYYRSLVRLEELLDLVLVG